MILPAPAKIEAERIYTWNAKHFQMAAPDLAEAHRNAGIIRFSSCAAWRYAVHCLQNDSQLPAQGHREVFLTGSKAGIQPSHAAKLNEQLTALNIATRPEQMNVPDGSFMR